MKVVRLEVKKTKPFRIDKLDLSPHQRELIIGLVASLVVIPIWISVSRFTFILVFLTIILFVLWRIIRKWKR